MALSGIEIYKLLPQTNCKECGFPTCLAFAMKLAAKQVELASCPYVEEESKTKLAASAEPPVRLITLKSNGNEIKVGNEVVLYRHEKTFYNRPGLFIRITDDMSADDIKTKIMPAEEFSVNYVGMDLALDGFAVESVSSDASKFSSAVEAVRNVSKKPLVLIGKDAAVIEAGLSKLEGETVLISGADESNWESMAEVAKKYKAALVVHADTLDALAELTQKLKDAEVLDLVLDPDGKSLGESLARSTQIRRLALKKNFRPFGYPIISYPCYAGDAAKESLKAIQAIAKYGGFVILDTFKKELAYGLLVLRQNIYTDPQKPIQVQPGLYEINNPKSGDPLMVTTNFSITYFSVANEVESSGQPGWLLVSDAEGMSVLTAWAAGNFDAERIAKDVKKFEVEGKVGQKRLIIPGHVAVLSGELEEELPGWEIKVGPREAVDIPSYLKQAL
jgi:acetyl-CoA decarbonylase/synthase complex subunit gamma